MDDAGYEVNLSKEIDMAGSTGIVENGENEETTDHKLRDEADHSMEAVVNRFSEELEVDEDIAMRLYLGGYWSMEELMDAVPDDLRMVEGITPTMARKLHSEIKRFL